MQYLASIPALKFLHFRAHGTRSRRFVQFEQPAASQSWEIDIFVIFDPKKWYLWYIKVLSLHIARYWSRHLAALFFLYVSKNYARRQNFRWLGSLEGEFDHFLWISRHSQIFSEHCYVAVTPTGSILTQSENYFPRFSQCIRRCEHFRSLAALEVILTFSGGACWRENCRFWALLQKITIVLSMYVPVRAKASPLAYPAPSRRLVESLWIVLRWP